MWDDIHLHRMGLASVREALGFTQTDLAAELGVTQSNVAQTERRMDILVSTPRPVPGRDRRGPASRGSKAGRRSSSASTS